jgi:2,4-dienoyl-CoA reductase-like NADH-dependent reductase (Old Yellow Enzyme family)
MPDATDTLFQPLELPCGTVLKNRIAKAAMSDSLGDGCGNPTQAQANLYNRWAKGGLALSIIGEVQGNPNFAEKPGNLVLRQKSDLKPFQSLAKAGAVDGAKLWIQLGHAGAMAYPPISTPKGPSALSLPGLTCDALTRQEITDLPEEFAQTARLAQKVGFGGVEIHAAHGFLLSQFLSPLFNRRTDSYGGSITNRSRLTLEILEAVRSAVGPKFPIGIKLNATDQLQGGLEASDALSVIRALDQTGIDLIEISGGTYFPGAPSSSDAAASGPYFLNFAAQTRPLTRKPLMVTGGFKTRAQVTAALTDCGVDMVGLARAVALDPTLPNGWRENTGGDPDFPKFTTRPEGGVTAWYSMRLKELGEGSALTHETDLSSVLRAYEDRDVARIPLWNTRFQPDSPD